MLAVGLACAYIGMLGTIVLEALESGALAKAGDVCTFSGFMHFARIFGGAAGAALMTRAISLREKYHSNLLALHVQAGDWLTDERLRLLSAALLPRSAGPEEAQYRAIEVLGTGTRAGLHDGGRRRIQVSLRKL